jgi:hypothetical protein
VLGIAALDVLLALALRLGAGASELGLRLRDSLLEHVLLHPVIWMQSATKVGKPPFWIFTNQAR